VFVAFGYGVLDTWTVLSIVRICSIFDGLALGFFRGENLGIGREADVDVAVLLGGDEGDEGGRVIASCRDEQSGTVRHMLVCTVMKTKLLHFEIHRDLSAERAS